MGRLPKDVDLALARYRDALMRGDSVLASSARVALEAAILAYGDAAREGALRERNEATDVSREAYIGNVERVVKALAAGAPTCLACGKEATCVGAYEGFENLDFACEECCSHGNEDGWCVPLASRPEPAPESGPLPCPVCDDGIEEPCPRCGRPAPRTDPEER